MEDIKIDEPIAERKLLLGSDDVLVLIGKPRLSKGGDEYYCPYSITCGDETKVSYAVGLDSVQSIQLVMKKIGVDLAYLSNVRDSSISWLPDTPGDTGFPP